MDLAVRILLLEFKIASESLSVAFVTPFKVEVFHDSVVDELSPTHSCRTVFGFVQELEEKMAATTGKVASVCGRFYAMDRDKRWERVKLAYDLLVEGKGEAFESAVKGIEASYAADVTDEFIKPIVITKDGRPLATVEEGDAVIFYNFRNDRARELTSVLTQQDMPDAGMHTIPLYYCCLTPYDASFQGVHILFPKENVTNTLGEYISQKGLRQLHTAETEKYAHVTFFFNGGRETPFENEDRILVNSPKVATYDLQPEMSAPQVCENVLKALDNPEYQFVEDYFTAKNKKKKRGSPVSAKHSKSKGKPKHEEKTA